jgi:hypothetical protein
MRRLIEELCRHHQFDVIHTHLIRMAQYTAGSGHPLRALDLTDAVSLYLQRFLLLEKNLLKKYLLKIELSASSDMRLLHNFEFVLFVPSLIKRSC